MLMYYFTIATAPEIAIKNGRTQNKIAVNLQLITNPIIIPLKNVATYCVIMLNLLPMPSRILSKSLKQSK